MTNIVYINNLRNLKLGKIIRNISNILDTQTTTTHSKKNITLYFISTEEISKENIIFFSEFTYYIQSLLEKGVEITIIFRGIFPTVMENILDLNLKVFASATSFFQSNGCPLSDNEKIQIF